MRKAVIPKVDFFRVRLIGRREEIDAIIDDIINIVESRGYKLTRVSRPYVVRDKRTGGIYREYIRVYLEFVKP